MIVWRNNKFFSRVTFLRLYYGYGEEVNRDLIMQADINNYYALATRIIVDHEARKYRQLAYFILLPAHY